MSGNLIRKGHRVIRKQMQRIMNLVTDRRGRMAVLIRNSRARVRPNTVSKQVLYPVLLDIEIRRLFVEY